MLTDPSSDVPRADDTAVADIVIPVYNEGRNIRASLDSFRSLTFNVRVLICYDRDDDDTLPALGGYEDFFEIVPVRNRGAGPLDAVLSGFAASTAPCVIVFPADDDFNAPRLNVLIRKFQDGFDIVAASRFMPGGTMEGCPWVKAVLVRVTAWFMWRIAGVPTRDATSGLRLFSRRVIRQIPVEAAAGFAYSIELLVKAHRLGWPIAEVPFEWRERTVGQSRFKVFKWAPQYLRWVGYALATTFLRRGPDTVPLVGGGRQEAEQDREQEAQFFDRFEAEHGEYDVLDEAAYRRIISKLQRSLQLRSGMTCIDLGCGTGAFTKRLQALRLALTGVDISARSIERAQQRGGAVYLVGDICDVPLPSASYDFAVMSGVLHHFPASDTRVRSLREAFRLLKPGGRFFSYDPNGFSPSMFLYRDPRSPLYSEAGKTHNEILLTHAQLAGELKAAGFAQVEVTGLSGISYRFVEGPLARALLPIYNGVYERLMRLPLLEKRFGTFLIAIATKPGS
jgi:SAM-dependent methyltransferase